MKNLPKEIGHLLWCIVPILYLLVLVVVGIVQAVLLPAVSDVYFYGFSLHGWFYLSFSAFFFMFVLAYTWEKSKEWHTIFNICIYILLACLTYFFWQTERITGYYMDDMAEIWRITPSYIEFDDVQMPYQINTGYMLIDGDTYRIRKNDFSLKLIGADDTITFYSLNR